MLSRRLAVSSIAVAGREALAFARQAWLLRHDVVAPAVPARVGAGEDVVVLLHGLFATAGVLRPLRTAIERSPGIHTAAISYPPGPGVEQLALRLKSLLAELPASARVHLVGHSLGGIVCRYFAQHVGDPRIAQTISMASPFAGVPRARLWGFGDLDPESTLLRRIRLSAGSFPDLPHLSIIAGSDSIVRSPVSHALPGGDVVVMDHRGHNAILFDDEVAELVARRIVSRREELAERAYP